MGRTTSTIAACFRLHEDPAANDGADQGGDNNSLAYTKNGDNDCADGKTTGIDGADATSKNVGDLSIDNAEPISFNHLTGHFTEALTSTADGGADQTASWGGTPVVRPAVNNPANMMLITGDYTTLNGMRLGRWRGAAVWPKRTPLVWRSIHVTGRTFMVEGLFERRRQF